MTSKMIKSFLIGLGGAVLTYGLQFVTGADFGAITPILVAALSAGVNYLKILAENFKAKE